MDHLETLTVSPERQFDATGSFVPPVELRVPQASDFIVKTAYEMITPLSRFGVIPPENKEIVVVSEYGYSDEILARFLAKIEPVDPNLKKIDLSTDQGLFDGTVLTAAKAEAAIEVATDPKDKSAFRKLEDKVLKNVADVLAKVGGKKSLAAISSVSLIATACSTVLPPKTPDAPSTLAPVATETITIPTENPDIAADPSETLTPAPAERLPVTADRVKNVGASLEISEDAKGNLSGLPTDTTDEKKAAVKAFYDAIQEKFPTSTVYYDQDPGTSGQWILYAELGDRLFYQTVSYNNSAGTPGPEQYFDSPMTFNYVQNTDGTKSWQIVGDYQALKIPDGGIGVIWDNGLPQFLSGKNTLSNGDTYYSYFMNYQTLAEDENPWMEVPGVTDLIKNDENINQAELGTVVLDSEYNLGGKVEINAENSAAFYSYLTDAFWRINKDYFANLGVTNSADAQKYMKSNILPAGFEYPANVSGDGSYAVKLIPSTVPIDFRNFGIRLVDYQDYTTPPGFSRSTLVTMYDSDPDWNDLQTKGNAVLVGFALVSEGTGISKLAIEIIQAKQIVGAELGFPDTNGNFSQGKLDEIDLDIRTLAYGLRSLDYSQPTDILKNDPTFDPIKGFGYSFPKPNKSLKIFTEMIPFSILPDSNENLPGDFPQSILILSGK